jgi:hypothetical protein
MRRTEIRPLAQVGLAENHRAGRAQVRSHGRILCRNRTGQRKRTCRRVHGVGRVDVVLDQHRNAVQRPAHFSALAFRIELVGDLQCVGIEFDDGVQRRSGCVYRGDAVEVLLHDRVRGQFTGSHASFQFSDADFFQSEHGRRVRRRARWTADGKRDGNECCCKCDAFHADPR